MREVDEEVNDAVEDTDDIDILERFEPVAVIAAELAAVFAVALASDIWVRDMMPEAAGKIPRLDLTAVRAHSVLGAARGAGRFGAVVADPFAPGVVGLRDRLFFGPAAEK